MARNPTRRQLAVARAERVQDQSFTYSWLFPVILSLGILVVVWIVLSSLGLPTGPSGKALSARLTWGVAAMLFFVFFIFGVVACLTVMFRCGAPEDAVNTATWTTIVGVAALGASLLMNDVYWGPDAMKQYLDNTAFKFTSVRMISSLFDGCAIWAAVLIVATSSVILKNEVKTPEELSRQLRGSKVLLYTSAALLIAGVAQTGALHRWPAHELTGSLQKTAATALEQEIEATAVAISTAVGTLFSLVLAAAYLPLGLILRQRAYRVVKPWERTEAWLAIHGFALQPTQQLAKILMVLSPLLAGGPVTQLINLLTHAGQ